MHRSIASTAPKITWPANSFGSLFVWQYNSYIARFEKYWAMHCFLFGSVSEEVEVASSLSVEAESSNLSSAGSGCSSAKGTTQGDGKHNVFLRMKQTQITSIQRCLVNYGSKES